jgi:NitT/TauT family transport system permease protein
MTTSADSAMMARDQNTHGVSRLTETQVLERARGMYSRGRAQRWLRSAVSLYCASLLLALLAWYAVILLFSLPAYLLPAPHDVAVAGFEARSLLLSAGGATLTEILAAFALCVVVGLPVGLLIASSQIAERLINPLLVLSQGIPKIALAPVFLAWFGFGFQANLAIAFLIAVFPVVVNTVLGMHALDPAMIRLGRSQGASWLRLFWFVRLPTAAPSIFAGMKIAITFAAIGAIIGEFAAGTDGLGYVIQVTVGNLDMPLGFAAITATALVGLVTYAGVGACERVLLRSHPGHRRQ